MRLMTESVDIDLVAAMERAQAWDEVRTAMKLGMVTAENISWEDRNAVRSFFEKLPIIEPVDPRRGLARIIGEANLREGWDWCFATSRDGTFGVFSLDEPSRTLLDGAALHLWADEDDYPERVDFIDLPAYQDSALEAALAA